MYIIRRSLKLHLVNASTPRLRCMICCSLITFSFIIVQVEVTFEAKLCMIENRLRKFVQLNHFIRVEACCLNLPDYVLFASLNSYAVKLLTKVI